MAFLSEFNRMAGPSKNSLHFVPYSPETLQSNFVYIYSVDSDVISVKFLPFLSVDLYRADFTFCGDSEHSVCYILSSSVNPFRSRSRGPLCVKLISCETMDVSCLQ